MGDECALSRRNATWRVFSRVGRAAGEAAGQKVSMSMSMSIDGVVQAEYLYNALGQQAIRRLTQTGQTIHNIFDLDRNRIAEYDYDAGLEHVAFNLFHSLRR